ncbi:MAG: family 16 glycoside hydrolase [Armatimonadota bacterium]|nr:family 16 glycoside hydrolase [Armatimonadota bacterium]
MKTSRVISVAFCIALSAWVGQGATAATWSDDFDDGDFDGWFVAGGAWEVIDGALHQTAPGWGRHCILLRKRLDSGSISLRAMATAKAGDEAPFDWGSFGVILRFRRGQGATKVRLGSYGGASLDGPPQDVPLCRFSPEVGRWYEVRVELTAERVVLWIDGQRVGETETEIAAEDGYIGLYAESQAAFDDVAIDGEWVDLAAADPLAGGSPDYELVWANWRPERANPMLAIPVTGSIYLYVRNTGDGHGAIESASALGRPAVGEAKPDWIAFVRQRPMFLAPGRLGQIEIRLRGVPEKVGSRLLASPDDMIDCDVTVSPVRGRRLNARVALGGAYEPVQVNFFGFSEDLTRMYAYLQNNRAVYGRDGSTYTISRVWVDGVEVTDQTRFGSRVLASDVVPLEVALPRRLRRGEAVVLLVETEEGLMTGHQLRAFPSEFNVLVYTGKQIPRTDWLEDIGNHCATAVPHRAGPDEVWDRFGFKRFPMIGRTPNFIYPAESYGGEDLLAIWVDEVDKAWGQPVERHMQWFSKAEEYFLLDDRRLPCLSYNFVSPQASSASGHLVVGDTVMHSYGYFMCPATGGDFGYIQRLPYREFRLGRRPFWPYFRDGEIPVPVDPDSREVLPLADQFQRCLTPKEQRRITYGVLMEGAKSIAHWGYWATEKTGHYYIDGPLVRTGLGALAGNWAWGYIYPDDVAGMLKDNWDEIGRLNAEMRTVGPELAIADVCYRAEVTRCAPARAPNGKPAAAATALIAGCDTMILLVLNQNIDLGESFAPTGPLSNPNSPVSYEPVAVEVELSVPHWLRPASVFGVSHRGLEDVEPRDDGKGGLVFTFPELSVSRMIVITADPRLRGECSGRLARLQELLDAADQQTPIRAQ